MVRETPPAKQGLESLRIVRPEKEKPVRRNPAFAIIAFSVVALGLCAGGYAFYSRTIGRPPAVQTMIVATDQSGRAKVLLAGTGYIVTRHKYITIGTKILGQIVSEPIEEGQRIKVGDLLAQIDDRDYQAQLRQASAARDLAEETLRLARRKADRAGLLIGSGAISRDEYDTAMSAAGVAKAALARDSAAVDYARFEVSQCVISSPINGIVLQKYREVGDTINFGGQIQAGGGATDIVQLADTDDMRAEVDINEADIARIRQGTPASVILDSYPDRTFEASVVKVYPAADRQKGTVKVAVHLENPDLQIIEPEMSAKVSFLESAGPTTAAAPVTIPQSAIRVDGNENCVWIVRDGTAHKVGVICGKKAESRIEILHGLKDGDAVVVTPSIQLLDGVKVSALKP
jgi:RND family efflux transporter MFP subunit